MLLQSAPAAWVASAGSSTKSLSGLLQIQAWPCAQLLQHTVVSSFLRHLLWKLCGKFLGVAPPCKGLTYECPPLAPWRVDFQPAPGDRFPENSAGMAPWQLLCHPVSHSCALSCKVCISALRKRLSLSTLAQP